MDLQLKGKRALVTGGSRGIGKAIAQALVAEGVRVVICSRDAGAGAATAAELASDVQALSADTSDDAQVDRLVARTVDLLGGLDIVVNNAARPAIPPEVPGLAGIDSGLFLDELNTKLVGYLRVARAAAPHMIAAGWGRIINIAGLGARSTGNIPNATRNIAIAAMNKSLADELGPQGINCTVVHPGLTRTEGVQAAIARRAGAQGMAPAEMEKMVASQSLIGRLVTPEEVAMVVAFLASPLSVAINGDVIAAGGGQPGAIFV